MQARVPHRRRACRSYHRARRLHAYGRSCSDGEHPGGLSPEASDRDPGGGSFRRDLRRSFARRSVGRRARRRDGTGADLAPGGGRRARAMLSAAGVPPNGVTVHHYHPDNPRQLPTVRLSYPRISATAGPCGLWPEDLGPSINNRGYIENRSYYNFGCAYQRNMAAMVGKPSALLQPRPETPAYTVRRTEGFEKYRKGTSTSTVYPEAEKAKLSDTGK